MSGKYIVGIDLGTTNSALAQCDASSAEENNQIRVRGIPQLVNPSEVAERTLLPSFLYIPSEFDFPKRQHCVAVGTRAEICDRRIGAQTGSGESKPVGRVGKILAFIRRREPYCGNFTLAIARRGSEIVAGGRIVAILAALAHRLGKRRGSVSGRTGCAVDRAGFVR